MKNNKLAQELKRLRKEKKLTIKELSKLSEVSEASIINYEKGKFVPNLISLRKLSASLNCKYEALFELREEN